MRLKQARTTYAVVAVDNQLLPGMIHFTAWVVPLPLMSNPLCGLHFGIVVGGDV